MPLTDDEANQEMKKMMAFIMQEATEKAREIHVKADEEFNIEKAKLVRSETAIIEGQFERKLRQAEVRRKIAQSSQINKTRLTVLQARDAVLDDILQEARQTLSQVSTMVDYQDLLNKLTLQCLYRLVDDEVAIQCRQEDREAAIKAIEYARHEYGLATGRKVRLTLDENNWLAKESAGGVVASTLRGRIRVCNTLESRLKTTCEKLMPVIRTEVFGPPPTRRFFD